MARFVVSLILLIASIAGPVVLEGGRLIAYVGISAFIIEAFVPFFAVLAVWGFPQIGRAWKDAFAPPADPDSSARSVRIWEFTEKACYATGVLGFLLGMVIVFGHLEELMPTIGAPLAVGLLGPIYGLFFGLFSRIMRARVLR